MANLHTLVAALANADSYELAEQARKEIQYLGLRADSAEMQQELVAAYTDCVSDHARQQILWLLELNISTHADFIALKRQLTGTT